MGRQSATELARKELIDKVKSNKLDFTSCEVQSMIHFSYLYYYYNIKNLNISYSCHKSCLNNMHLK